MYKKHTQNINVRESERESEEERRRKKTSRQVTVLFKVNSILTHSREREAIQ